MKPRRLAITTALAALLLTGLGAHAVHAQDVRGEIPRRPDGKPDLNGIWQAVNSANFNLEPHAAAPGPTDELGAIAAVPPGAGVVVGGEIPYLPEAAERRAENYASRRTEDPEAKCFLPGVPRATYMPHPFQIFHTDGDIFIAYQYAGATRTVFMSEHSEAPIDSWMGWSNGRWEDDTLVVEVTGLNGETWLDRAGNFGSASMRVVERYTMIGPDHMHYEARIEDPNVFSRPWTIEMPLYRRIEAGARLMEFKCVPFAEELMYGHLSKDAAARPETGERDE